MNLLYCYCSLAFDCVVWYFFFYFTASCARDAIEIDLVWNLHCLWLSSVKLNFLPGADLIKQQYIYFFSCYYRCLGWGKFKSQNTASCEEHFPLYEEKQKKTAKNKILLVHRNYNSSYTFHLVFCRSSDGSDIGKYQAKWKQRGGKNNWQFLLDFSSPQRAHTQFSLGESFKYSRLRGLVM